MRHRLLRHLVAPSLAVALLAASATAQFGGILDWTHSGDPSGWFWQSADELIITGPAWDACTTAETWAHVTTTATLSGTVSVHYSFDNQDGGFGSWAAEDPSYIVDGEVTYVGPGDFFSIWEGDVAFQVEAGQTWGFGVQSIDCGWGPGVLTVTDFVFVPDVWQELGHALAGTFGEPDLTGTGLLIAGSPWELGLVDAPPGAAAFLVLGFDVLDQPFKGGVLVPDPAQVFALVTSPAGRIIFGGTWPSGVPAGFDFVTQYWIDDPGGPKDYAASNAVMAITP